MTDEEIKKIFNDVVTEYMIDNQKEREYTIWTHEGGLKMFHEAMKEQFELNWGQSKLNNNNMIDEIMKKYSHLEEAYDSKESMKEHFLSGEVTKPIKDVIDLWNTNPNNPIEPKKSLPSKYQCGDPVRLDFFHAGFIKNCIVIKVHFTDSKVLYDVDVTINTDVNGKPNKTRLYNIDSCFVVD